ncbi:hypothetical protein [Actinoplanes sp. L3-i22]|uniref:hypothetical protein n=1 Tax=Actinoplanes sp. L3-i22 TaxID=2836373 RepID=UPI001C7983FF|nr:hypothetical protein [Actinoplanes sp. L3-i22]BCY14532.1 hypothetical protein L3i22_096200 [Actinoplanes sp. L3-i22]
MALTDADVAADLAPAGLIFLNRVREKVTPPLPNPPPYYTPASCRWEHGRFDSDRAFQPDDPDLVAKVNADWFRMATEFGVLDERRELLLAVSFGEVRYNEYTFARVRLADEWDLAGSGSTLLGSGFGELFTERYLPEFTMLSTDHKAMLCVTVWGSGTISTLVIRPDRLTGD